MAPNKWCRTCEICRKRYGRLNTNKRKFMSRFPLDEVRCRQWVKIIGKEDLAYIPIEKLHQIKYVCGDHFEDKDFNRTKSRLKKWAVPSLFINAQTLSEQMLAEFPCHVATLQQEPNVQVISSEKGTQVIDAQTIQNRVLSDVTELVHQNNSAPSRPASATKVSAVESHAKQHDHSYALQPQGRNQDCPDPSTSEILIQSCTKIKRSHSPNDADTADEPDSEHFSWQNTEIVPVQADDACIEAETAQVSENVTVEMTIDYEDNAEQDSKQYARAKGVAKIDPQLHEGYQCNICKGQIVRFRYTCVQCADFDLCAACEARAEHDHHYVLRVPGPRPHGETQELLSQIRGALQLGSVLFAQPDDVTVKSETEQCEVDSFPEEKWLLDAPPSKETMEHVFEDSSLHEKSPQKPHKQTSRRVQKKRRRFEPKPSSDTSTDETDSDDKLDILHSQNNQTLGVHKNTKSMFRQNELEEIHTQIVVPLPERKETEKAPYFSVHRKKDNVTEPEENQESDFSGDDENYVPDASESASRVISVKSDGGLITVLPLKRKRDNVVTRARSSNVAMPQKAEQIDKSMVQKGPYIQLERLGTEALETYSIKR